MNVVVENQPNCLATLRIELPSDRVVKARTEVTQEYCRHARIPGYRPGKAPRHLIATRFAKAIAEETGNQLVREAISEAIKEKGLKVLSVSLSEEPHFHSDDTMHFAALATLAPDFELPDYSSIPGDVALKEVTEADVDEMLESAREPHATFEPAGTRPLEMGDFAVLSFDATVNGQPLAEAVPGAPAQICSRRNSWLLMAETSLVPGFCTGLVGLESGNERDLDLTMPADFPIERLAGKILHYHVILHDIQVRKLPELDDALAEKILPGSTVAELRAKCRERLEMSASQNFQSAKRQAALDFLLSKVECELPESYVNRELRGILRDVVRENQARGVSDEEIRSHQDELIGAAQQSARQRVRSNFLLLRVAEKENLEATESDLTNLVLEMSMRYEIPVKKLIADIRKRGALEELREQVLVRKALDLLAANVSVASTNSPSA
ncbi:MAG: trigger factor [Terrimicrobiaceae bacterium]